MTFDDDDSTWASEQCSNGGDDGDDGDIACKTRKDDCFDNYTHSALI